MIEGRWVRFDEAIGAMRALWGREGSPFVGRFYDTTGVTMLPRPVEEVEDRLPIGSSAACLDLLGRYQRAGLGRVLLWPVKDEVDQLERVAAEIIAPLGPAS